MDYINDHKNNETVKLKVYYIKNILHKYYKKLYFYVIIIIKY